MSDTPQIAPEARARHSRKRIVAYWIFTVWICLPMALGGVFDLTKAEQALAIIRHLGYPDYFLVMLGAAKLLSVVALLAPRLPRVKEWAYAGIAFDLIAAAVSHAAVGDPAKEVFIPALLLAVMTASYVLRPPARRLPDPA